MSNVSNMTPEQRAEIRAHAERGDIDGVMRHLDCDGVLELLDALDERDRLRGDVDRLLRDQVYDVIALRGELAAMTAARDEACEIADRHIFAPDITVHVPPAAVHFQESWSATATVDTGAVYRDRARVAELRKVGA